METFQVQDGDQNIETVSTVAGPFHQKYYIKFFCSKKNRLEREHNIKILKYVPSGQFKNGAFCTSYIS